MSRAGGFSGTARQAERVAGQLESCAARLREALASGSKFEQDVPLAMTLSSAAMVAQDLAEMVTGGDGGVGGVRAGNNFLTAT